MKLLLWNGYYEAVTRRFVTTSLLCYSQMEDGMTSLHLAAKAGKLDAVKFLLETKKIDVNIKVCQ